MLHTEIRECEGQEQFNALKQEADNIMLTCGRMGPMCIPVYGIMESIEQEYQHVAFRVIDFDTPLAGIVRTLPEVQGFYSLPLVVYIRDGKVVKASGGLQSKSQVTTILDEVFTK